MSKKRSTGKVVRPVFGAPPIDPVASAIEQHQSSYAAWLAAHTSRVSLHEAFDPSWVLDNADHIRVALIAFYVADAPAETERYFGALAASEKAAEVEEIAWKRLQAIDPTTRSQLEMWTAYMLRHAAEGRDQVEGATLGWALKRCSALLSEHMAA